MDSAARLRVVIIDDNEEWRQILTRLLQPVYDVIGHVERGDEVLAFVSQLHPDIITMDVSLPRLSGLNVLPAVRAALPHAVIVIVSTTATPLYRSEAAVRGADSYVAKNQAYSELLPSIAGACAERADQHHRRQA